MEWVNKLWCIHRMEWWKLNTDTEGGAQCATPQHATQVHWLFWAVRPLKNKKCSPTLSLISPYLPEDRASKRNSAIINLFPGSFINQEKTDSYHRRRDENLTPYLDRLCHKISSLPSLLPRAHLSFLKIISSPLRGLGPLSPLPITMVLKPEF